MSELKGVIEQKDEIRATTKANLFKLGVKINGEWYGIFSSKSTIEELNKKLQVGVLITASFTAVGKYKNILPDSINISKEETPAEKEKKIAEGILAQERKEKIDAFVECLEDAQEILNIFIPKLSQKQKEIISSEAYWDVLTRIANTLHIGNEQRRRR